MPNPTVSVLKTSPETVLDDYSRLMKLAGYEQELRKDVPTLLKLNLSWSLYFPACSTSPWQLEGVIKAMRLGGYSEVSAVENETVVTDPVKGAELNRWNGIFKRYNIAYQPLNGVEWVKYHAKGELLALYDIFGEDGHEIPKTFIGKNIMHLPTMKCHGHTTMTGAMKNAFGGLITKKRHHCHKKIHEVLVDLLTIQKEIHPGIFAVMDGTVCGNGAGPRTMIPECKGYILASADQVAIDSIAAKMMGFEPMAIPFIKLAHDRGLGCGDPAQIEVLGHDVGKVNFGFSTGKSPVIAMDQLFRKGLFSFIEPLLFHTPLFKLCVFGSETYHDHVWYRTIGVGRIRQFYQTGWGELFLKY